MIRFLVALFFFVSSVASAIPQDATPGVYTPGFYSTANFVKNPSCATNTTNVTASGGSLSRTTTTPLSSTASCLIDASASGQTYKFSTRTIDNGLNGQNCEARFTFSGDGTLYKAYVEQPSGTKVSQEVTLVDTTSATNGKDVSLTFPCGSNSNSTILTIESTSSSAAAIRVSDAYVGKITTTGTVQNTTDWISFTPTGSWVSNSTYTGAWRRVGDSMEVTFKVATSGAPTSASLTINLPSGYSIDTSKLVQSANGYTVLGRGSAADNGVNNYNIVVGLNTSTSVALYAMDASSSYVNAPSLTQAVPFTFGSGDTVVGTFSVPISGWTSTSTAVRSDQSNYEWTAFTPSTVGSQGFGTIAAESCFHKRDGQFLLMNCRITAGTVGASQARITLPSSLTIASSVSSQRLAEGYWIRDNSSATTVKRGNVLMNGGDAFITFSRDDYNSTTSPLSPQNGSTIFTSSDVISFYAKVPIQGWGENQKAPILVGSVVSNTSGSERSERAVISGSTVGTNCSSSPCAVSKQGGTWISSTTRSGTGSYSVNFVSGMFSDSPSCSCMAVVNGSNRGYCGLGAVATTSSVPIYTYNVASPSTLADAEFTLICQGPR